MLTKASIRSIVNLIDDRYITWVFFNLEREALLILCFIEKSSKIPSYRKSLKMTSLLTITNMANPDGINGLSHRKHSCNHRFARAVGMEHLIHFNSKWLSKYCWAFEKFDKAKKAMASSFSLFGITLPFDAAIKSIFWVLSDRFPNKWFDFFLSWCMYPCKFAQKVLGRAWWCWDNL